MFGIISRLLMYGDVDKDSILYSLGEIYRRFESGEYEKTELISDVKRQVKRLLVLATDQGFNDNLWHNYIAYFLMTNENPFSLVCEKNTISGGTVTELVREDMKLIRQLFDYDFTELENALGINCLSILKDYRSVPKNIFMYNKNVSGKVRAFSKELEAAKDDEQFYGAVTKFYYDVGVGMFGLNKAFRLSELDGGFDFRPINNMDQVTLDDLVGYEIQKQELIYNTQRFVDGAKANNVLLFGDSGTGKSTCIKAIVNRFYGQGLRMIEIYKHQFKYLSSIISRIKTRNYKFIIYMDDLSFEEHEIEYKFLKAVIEGGVETKPDNVLIYATSNRRHLIKETWSDRNDTDNSDDKHHSDTVEEKLSLVNRFGVAIRFIKPMPKEYNEIVRGLAKANGIDMPDDELILKAHQWEISHGGMSGRTAQQFINHISE